MMSRTADIGGMIRSELNADEQERKKIASFMDDDDDFIDNEKDEKITVSQEKVTPVSQDPLPLPRDDGVSVDASITPVCADDIQVAKTEPAKHEVDTAANTSIPSVVDTGKGDATDAKKNRSKTVMDELSISQRIKQGERYIEEHVAIAFVFKIGTEVTAEFLNAEFYRIRKSHRDTYVVPDMSACVADGVVALGPFKGHSVVLVGLPVPWKKSPVMELHTDNICWLQDRCDASFAPAFLLVRDESVFFVPVPSAVLAKLYSNVTFAIAKMCNNSVFVDRAGAACPLLPDDIYKKRESKSASSSSEKTSVVSPKPVPKVQPPPRPLIQRDAVITGEKFEDIHKHKLVDDPEGTDDASEGAKKKVLMKLSAENLEKGFRASNRLSPGSDIDEYSDIGSSEIGEGCGLQNMDVYEDNDVNDFFVDDDEGVDDIDEMERRLGDIRDEKKRLQMKMDIDRLRQQREDDISRRRKKMMSMVTVDTEGAVNRCRDNKDSVYYNVGSVSKFAFKRADRKDIPSTAFDPSDFESSHSFVIVEHLKKFSSATDTGKHVAEICDANRRERVALVEQLNWEVVLPEKEKKNGKFDSKKSDEKKDKKKDKKKDEKKKEKADHQNRDNIFKKKKMSRKEYDDDEDETPLFDDDDNDGSDRDDESGSSSDGSSSDSSSDADSSVSMSDDESDTDTDRVLTGKKRSAPPSSSKKNVSFGSDKNKKSSSSSSSANALKASADVAAEIEKITADIDALSSKLEKHIKQLEDAVSQKKACDQAVDTITKTISVEKDAISTLTAKLTVLKTSKGASGSATVIMNPVDPSIPPEKRWLSTYVRGYIADVIKAHPGKELVHMESLNKKSDGKIMPSPKLKDSDLALKWKKWHVGSARYLKLYDPTLIPHFEKTHLSSKNRSVFRMFCSRVKADPKFLDDDKFKDGESLLKEYEDDFIMLRQRVAFLFFWIENDRKKAGNSKAAAESVPKSAGSGGKKSLDDDDD